MEQLSFYDLYDIPVLQAFINSLSNTLHANLCLGGLHGEAFIKATAFSDEREPEDVGIRIMIGEVHLANLLVLFPDSNNPLALTDTQQESALITLRYIGILLSRYAHRGLQLKTTMNSLENSALLYQKERAALEQLAERDSLTGLYNRHRFDKFMAECAQVTTVPTCIISADANFLKLTNDVFGHESGDTLLRSVARIMQDLAKNGWLVARCGGDEFRVLLPNTKLETALDYCRRVDRNCRKDKSLPIPLSVALGVAEWNPEIETLEDCFNRADEKMYQNKQVIKKELHLPDAIMERLYDRQILNREVVEISTRMVYEFAIYIGLSEEDAKKLRLAIHYEDIGMIKLPESFMIRGQSRTPEETARIHDHVYHSNKLARQFEELYPIADIILYTHENWDGNGYPEHRIACHTPMASRIIRVVNNYVYWSTPTLVGSNLTKEEAKKRLKQYSGQMYDPDLVPKFLKFLEEKNY